MVCPYFGGHGVGQNLHENPLILHDLSNTNDATMEAGNTFTIEPILMLRAPSQYAQWEDKWTFVAPGVPSAQWEHIIAVTPGGCKVLTKRQGEVWDEEIPQATSVDF